MRAADVPVVSRIERAVFGREAWPQAAFGYVLAVFGASRPYYFSGRFCDSPQGATFRHTVEFIGAQFHDDAQFDWVLFDGDVDFTGAQFHSEYRLEDLRPTDRGCAHQQ